VRNPVVKEWIKRAERHWRNAEPFAHLPVSDQSGMLVVQEVSLTEASLSEASLSDGIGCRGCWCTPNPNKPGASTNT